MPRGLNSLNKTVEQQLTEVETRIASLQNRLANLKSRRKTLIEAKEKADFKALFKAVKESGLSANDLLRQMKTTA